MRLSTTTQVLLACLPVVVLAAIAVWFVFPVADDAWLTLLIKEAGHDAIRPVLQHRPVFAAILSLMSTSIPAYLSSGLVLNVLIWLLMALETASLWKWLNPANPEYGAAAGLLAVSPVITLTQLTTYTVTVPINVTIVLGYAAFFMLAAPERYSLGAFRMRLGCAMAAIAFATVLSEYAFATAAIACVFFLYKWSDVTWPRRGRHIASIAAISGGWLVGTAVFRLTADLSTIPGNTYGGTVEILANQWKEILFLIVNAFWRSLFGAIFTAGSAVRFTWFEKSTLASVAFGGLYAVTLCLLVRVPRSQRSAAAVVRSDWLRWCWYFAALGAGLLPVVLRSPSVGTVGADRHIEDFGTRMYLTAAPLAACISITIFTRLTRQRYHWVVLGMVGFICGHAAFLHAWSIYSDRRSIDAIGSLVNAYIDTVPGLTVVVTSEYLGRDYEVTYWATKGWPRDRSRKAWFVWEGKLENRLGHPADRTGNCARITDLHIEVTGIHRTGSISQILYVDGTGAGPAVEPYCVGLASMSHAPPVARGAPSVNSESLK